MFQLESKENLAFSVPNEVNYEYFSMLGSKSHACHTTNLPSSGGYLGDK
jgi:hypothetical protein